MAADDFAVVQTNERAVCAATPCRAQEGLVWAQREKGSGTGVNRCVLSMNRAKLRHAWERRSALPLLERRVMFESGRRLPPFETLAHRHQPFRRVSSRCEAQGRRTGAGQDARPRE